LSGHDAVGFLFQESGQGETAGGGALIPSIGPLEFCDSLGEFL
jgi:hypothetical protein